MDQYILRENEETKIVSSPDYKFSFNKKTGAFARWGKTLKDDPLFSPFGPELADIEISTVCHQGCLACYKSNTPNGENMSLETFKKVFSKLPKTVCQVAFGVGSIDANEDLWNIFSYCRERGVVPNVTINGSRMTDEYYNNLAKYCGAVAVSHYDDDSCYNAVQELTNRDMTQINIHQILSLESLQQCYDTLDAKNTDPRLARLNAIVFLSLKPKGDRNCSHIIQDRQEYVKLIKYAVDQGVLFGFDSCFAPIFEDVAPDIFPPEQLKNIYQVCEPCESFGMFSCYIDVKGHYYPCSFTPGTPGWEEGIDMLAITDFMKDLWFSPRVNEGRNKSLSCNRRCLPYPELYRCLNGL
jgi:hypothetical protein